ncbi:hypothetical protein M9434_005068 [Picochlorum sp. BPE23]|nr:hypothetical protein M9434_005068 [Picochlorum sp. BPE23]
MAQLRYVLMMERDLPKAIEFLQKGIGARVRVATTTWAELDAGGTTIALKEDPIHKQQQQGDPCPSMEEDTHHSMQRQVTGPGMVGALQQKNSSPPMLVFDVDNLQHRLTTMLQMGAQMDGAVQYTLEGAQVAVVKSPSGTLIGMVEGCSP